MIIWFYFLPYFLRIVKEGRLLETNNKDLDSLIAKYGREELIPITSLSQVKYYIEHGIQPCFVYPSNRCDILAFWYLKKDTRKLFVDYRKYINDKYQVGE